MKQFSLLDVSLVFSWWTIYDFLLFYPQSIVVLLFLYFGPKSGK